MLTEAALFPIPFTPSRLAPYSQRCSYPISSFHLASPSQVEAKLCFTNIPGIYQSNEVHKIRHHSSLSCNCTAFFIHVTISKFPVLVQITLQCNTNIPFSLISWNLLQWVLYTSLSKMLSTVISWNVTQIQILKRHALEQAFRKTT